MSPRQRTVYTCMSRTNVCTYIPTHTGMCTYITYTPYLCRPTRFWGRRGLSITPSPRITCRPSLREMRNTHECSLRRETLTPKPTTPISGYLRPRHGAAVHAAQQLETRAAGHAPGFCGIGRKVTQVMSTWDLFPDLPSRSGHGGWFLPRRFRVCG